MTELLLVRHGETDWNRDQRVQGHTDVPLNATGLQQAHALAQRLSSTPLVAIYSSDLARARETATIVARRHVVPVELDLDLREKNFGSWEGLTDTEIAERFPNAARGAWGDGETTEDVAERATLAFERIKARHSVGPVLVISHGGTIRAILAHLGVEHGSIGNCQVFSAHF